MKKKTDSVIAWGKSLETLLADPAGVHSLAVFLEGEFAAENIRFWTACERWARSPSGSRPALAAALYNRFLAPGAPDPVNVDVAAGHLAADRLAQAPSDLFRQAQKQIFNLMQFDSYPRFLKSNVYQECLKAQLQGFPLPYPGDPFLAVTPNKNELALHTEKRSKIVKISGMCFLFLLIIVLVHVLLYIC